MYLLMRLGISLFIDLLQFLKDRSVVLEELDGLLFELESEKLEFPFFTGNGLSEVMEFPPLFWMSLLELLPVFVGLCLLDPLGLLLYRRFRRLR